jgi:hypothetical protein
MRPWQNVTDSMQSFHVARGMVRQPMVQSRKALGGHARFVVALVPLLILAAGCKGKGGGESGAPNASNESGVSSVSNESGVPIGIVPCDAYAAKVGACLAKDPGARATREASFNRLTANWRRMAAVNKVAVQFSCQSALDNLGVTMPTCK